MQPWADCPRSRAQNIDERHRQKLIVLKTVSLAAADLVKYSQALDRALLKFHSTKMEDINRSVKELWNRTYQVMPTRCAHDGCSITA